MGFPFYDDPRSHTEVFEDLYRKHASKAPMGPHQDPTRVAARYGFGPERPTAPPESLPGRMGAEEKLVEAARAYARQRNTGTFQRLAVASREAKSAGLDADGIIKSTLGPTSIGPSRGNAGLLLQQQHRADQTARMAGQGTPSGVSAGGQDPRATMLQAAHEFAVSGSDASEMRAFDAIEQARNANLNPLNDLLAAAAQARTPEGRDRIMMLAGAFMPALPEEGGAKELHGPPRSAMSVAGSEPVGPASASQVPPTNQQPTNERTTAPAGPALTPGGGTSQQQTFSEFLAANPQLQSGSQQPARGPNEFEQEWMATGAAKARELREGPQMGQPSQFRGNIWDRIIKTGMAALATGNPFRAADVAYNYKRYGQQIMDSRWQAAYDKQRGATREDLNALSGIGEGYRDMGAGAKDWTEATRGGASAGSGDGMSLKDSHAAWLNERMHPHKVATTQAQAGMYQGQARQANANADFTADKHQEFLDTAGDREQIRDKELAAALADVGLDAARIRLIDAQIADKKAYSMPILVVRQEILAGMEEVNRLLERGDIAAAETKRAEVIKGAQKLIKLMAEAEKGLSKIQEGIPPPPSGIDLIFENYAEGKQ